MHNMFMIMWDRKQQRRDVANPAFEIQDKEARKIVYILCGLVAGLLVALLVVFAILISHVSRIQRLEQQQKGVIIK